MPIYHIFFNYHLSFLQKSCISFAIEAKPLELYVPPDNHGIRYHIWRLVTSGPFENIIMLLIIGNTVLLMLKVKWIYIQHIDYSNEILSFFWGRVIKLYKFVNFYHSFFQFHGAPLFFADILGDFNMVFTLLFTVECVFKLISFGPRVSINYFT